jgi:hypothetical protein
MTDKTEWVQVGELADGFAPEANILEFVDDLIGHQIDLYAENGMLVRHKFLDKDKLVWEVLEGEGKGSSAEETYTATSIREGIYFVDFIKKNEKNTSVSLVLNLEAGNATILLGTLPDEKETMRPVYQRVLDGDVLTPVDAVFLQASINRPFIDGDGHQLTEELVGKRVRYQYNPKEFYEHIYLNPNYYTWQCLRGVEKGLAETDLCHFYKIDKDLYFFVWREKVIPTLGVVMIDLKRLKTTGKILGYDGADFKRLNNFPVGAFAKVLNTTDYMLD